MSKGKISETNNDANAYVKFCLPFLQIWLIASILSPMNVTES